MEKKHSKSVISCYIRFPTKDYLLLKDYENIPSFTSMISPLPDPLVELEGLTVLLLPLGPLGEEGADSVPSLLSWSLIIK